jgi:hypothetical protein
MSDEVAPHISNSDSLMQKVLGYQDTINSALEALEIKM